MLVDQHIVVGIILGMDFHSECLLLLLFPFHHDEENVLSVVDRRKRKMRHGPIHTNTHTHTGYTHTHTHTHPSTRTSTQTHNTLKRLTVTHFNSNSHTDLTHTKTHDRQTDTHIRNYDRGSCNRWWLWLSS